MMNRRQTLEEKLNFRLLDRVALCSRFVVFLFASATAASRIIPIIY